MYCQACSCGLVQSLWHLTLVGSAFFLFDPVGSDGRAQMSEVWVLSGPRLKCGILLAMAGFAFAVFLGLLMAAAATWVPNPAGPALCLVHRLMLAPNTVNQAEAAIRHPATGQLFQDSAGSVDLALKLLDKVREFPPPSPEIVITAVIAALVGNLVAAPHLGGLTERLSCKFPVFTRRLRVTKSEELREKSRSRRSRSRSPLCSPPASSSRAAGSADPPVEITQVDSGSDVPSPDPQGQGRGIAYFDNMGVVFVTLKTLEAGTKHGKFHSSTVCQAISTKAAKEIRAVDQRRAVALKLQPCSLCRPRVDQSS